MARKIIWSKLAQQDRYSIFRYWNKRNKSNKYSKKLNELFIAASEFVASNPTTGLPTDRASIRIKFVSHFALIYETTESELFVLSIFDTRQNPNKLDNIISKGEGGGHSH